MLKMHTNPRDNWLQEVSEFCVATLEDLNDKAQEGEYVSPKDQTMTDLCMGYLFLLSVCNTEGLLDPSKIQNSIDKNITIH
jgi:hypothetical protein|tara:strand:+ start:403 stop:645 length:243 start_codon:yes stop_codon:yes gene_type:complete